jgi:hypothetical protein
MQAMYRHSGPGPLVTHLLHDIALCNPWPEGGGWQEDLQSQGSTDLDIEILAGQQFVQRQRTCRPMSPEVHVHC